MKFFCTIFLLISLYGICFSQETSAFVFHITKFPLDGLLLDRGWKLQSGDDPAFARPDYDDNKWQDINPLLDIRDASSQIPKQGICWFRLHLSLDSNMLKDELALMVTQVGASEIYANGILIRQFGIVSADPARVMTYSPWGKPIPFPVQSNPEIVLSIRYAPEPDTKYLRVYALGTPALSIRANRLETSIDQYMRESGRQMNSTVFRIGLFLMLVILHFAFYLFYPSQKANLHFSLFALSIVATEMIALNTMNGINAFNNLHSAYYAAYFWGTIEPVSNFLLLTAFYTLFEQKKTWIYWALVCTVVINIFANTFYRWTWQDVTLFNSIIYAELMRIALKSVINKKRGALIIAAGATVFLIMWITFILGVPYNYMNTHISPTYTIGDLTYNLKQISIPIATSIYLGLDFAYTSASLKLKLSEVEYLSSKSIAQEKEKQQILSSVNETLEKQVTVRTAELKQSLEELKTTQAQLIQSEKMASLGELTAGIAHEIQNPLNFVNNFSDVNKELVDELQLELKSGSVQEAIAISEDIRENEKKINHHGKRADAIVRGMLQHSKQTSGIKEPTDINALVDEYLRLAYHGLRAKDKIFNTEIRTDFDATIGKINIVSQDIGRVLLNLYNNAFYAVGERQKVAGIEYEPLVTVGTKKLNDRMEIKVRDNGNGIPKNLVDKIFQPFFTTKPTGQGTGLGLSLVYDIIKAHGGEIKVETKEGEGSEFIVRLQAIQ